MAAFKEVGPPHYTCSDFKDRVTALRLCYKVHVLHVQTVLPPRVHTVQETTLGTMGLHVQYTEIYLCEP